MNSLKILDKRFPKAMDFELQSNQIKGDWRSWSPSPAEWLWELQYHVGKLQKAIQNNNKELIKELSADLANYGEKSYTLFGQE